MDLDKILDDLEHVIKKDIADATKNTAESIKNAKMTPELRKDLKTKQRYKPPKSKQSPNHTRGA